MRAGDHATWMARALELAGTVEGLTRPNPPVGAVVVHRGNLVGEGAHRKAGGPHAEIVALRRAGDAARGATLYVTLEPCCTTNRTPPCTEAILAAGLKRVVMASRDPNPIHGGKGVAFLRRHGVEVLEGVGREQGDALIEPFTTWILHGRPFIEVKLAVSLDGRIADRKRSSRWITGPASRAMVQDLRRRADAVMVGVETVLQDNPSLLPRPAQGRKTWRVICDSRGRIPLTSRVLRDAHCSRTLVAVTRNADPARLRRIEKLGAEVALLPCRHGKVALPALARHLAERGLLRVLCEGGGHLAAALARAALVDEWIWFTAPLLLGGDARPSLGGRGWLLDSAPRTRFVSSEFVGSDLVTRARPDQPKG